MSFLTGSRVYGIPNEDSDVDLVVLVTEEEKQKLIEKSDNGQLPCMYGPLNIIPVTSGEMYLKWQTALRECEQQKPVSRNEAVAIHQKHGATGLPFSKHEPSLAAFLG